MCRTIDRSRWYSRFVKGRTGSIVRQFLSDYCKECLSESRGKIQLNESAAGLIRADDSSKVPLSLSLLLSLCSVVEASSTR